MEARRGSEHHPDVCPPGRTADGGRTLQVKGRAEAVDYGRSHGLILVGHIARQSQATSTQCAHDDSRGQAG